MYWASDADAFAGQRLISDEERVQLQCGDGPTTVLSSNVQGLTTVRSKTHLSEEIAALHRSSTCNTVYTGRRVQFRFPPDESSSAVENVRTRVRKNNRGLLCVFFFRRVDAG